MIREETGTASPRPEGEAFLRSLLGAGVLLLVLRAVEPLFFGEDYYLTLSAHPFWIVILLAAVQNGFFVGVATAALASMLMDWPPRPVGVDITAHYLDLAVVPVQWLLAAIVIGGFRQGQIRKEQRLRRKNAWLEAANDSFSREIGRMDGLIDRLERAAAARDGRAGPKTTDVPGAALSALAALAQADDARLGEWLEDLRRDLGLEGLAVHFPDGRNAQAGGGVQVNAPMLERLRRDLEPNRAVPIAAADGPTVAAKGGEVVVLARTGGAAPRQAEEPVRGAAGAARPARAGGRQAQQSLDLEATK